MLRSSWGPTDEELLYETTRRAQESDTEVGERLATRWLPALRARRLPKRALEVTAAELGDRVRGGLGPFLRLR